LHSINQGPNAIHLMSIFTGLTFNELQATTEGERSHSVIYMLCRDT